MMRKSALLPFLFWICASCHPTSSDNATSQTTSTGLPSVPKAQAAAAAAPFDVKVTFSGLMVHVFGDDIGEKDRTIVLEDADHPIEFFVPAGIDTSKFAGLGISAGTPSAGMVELTTASGSFSGFSVRVVGWDPANKKVVSTMSPMLDRSSPTFDQFVPHLLKVSDGELNQSNLDSSMFDPVPDKKLWGLFFELNGGALTAEKACKQSHFIHDYEKKGNREFAKTVTLTGSVEMQPALQILTKGGTWQTITFTTLPTPPATFSIKAVTQSSTGLKMSHFPKFERLGNPKPKKFDDIFFVPCDDKGPSDPACSNNQWP